MAKPGRMKEIEREHNEPLENLIPRKLNEHGTIEGAAADLGVGWRALYQWVKDNDVQRRIVWEKSGTHVS